MADIIAMRPANLAKPRTFTSNERLMEEIQHAIFKSHQTYKEIAAVADVGHNTIARLAQGKTYWPRPKTLFGVLHSLGLGLSVVPVRGGSR